MYVYPEAQSLAHSKYLINALSFLLALLFKKKFPELPWALV